MKVAIIALLLCALCAVQGNLLPPGYESAEELANVLANEPASASRFAEAAAADTITFRETQTPGSVTVSDPNQQQGCGCQASVPASNGCNCQQEDGIDDDTSEFDAQIEQIEKDVKNLKLAIKETEECAKRLQEQEAELRALKEQKDHLEKEKEKKVLQAKLERQMRDLAEINRMSRSLRTKFNELKHTQKLIKTKMICTRSSLNQLDSEPEIDTDMLNDSAAMLGKQMEAMHKSQLAMLTSSHARNEQHLKNELDSAQKIHGLSIKAGENGDAYVQ
jgi:hypothetical protein